MNELAFNDDVIIWVLLQGMVLHEYISTDWREVCANQVHCRIKPKLSFNLQLHKAELKLWLSWEEKLYVSHHTVKITSEREHRQLNKLKQDQYSWK